MITSKRRMLEGSAAEAVACKSAAVRSAPIAGVLGGIVEKPRLKSLFLLRTDKVSSLGACTHRPSAKVIRILLKPHF